MRERLEFFIEVCEAVQHAHQKGIIHRDLKPGNILVSRDEEGVVTPKVIDFGVAKAINMELTDKTFFTVFGQMMGTPQYMSPEQTDLNAVDVDTRSDIYSLGVLLYELVTGEVPLKSDKLTSAGFDEMRRLIREEEPPRPSTRVGAFGPEELKRGAEARKIDPGRFRRFLQGDLDWVVMKALEKDRTRRYDTAQGLANDVRAFLLSRPVTAGPPGKTYLVRKFVARNRAAVVATVLIFLSLVGGLVVANHGRREAVDAHRAEEVERNRAEFRRLEGLVNAVWILTGQPGTRGKALKDLAEVGDYAREYADAVEPPLGITGDEVRKLGDKARNALFACMLWVDLEQEVLWADLGSQWVPAAMDAAAEKVVLVLDGRVLVRELPGGGERELQPVGKGEAEWEMEFLRMSPDGHFVAMATKSGQEWTLEIHDLRSPGKALVLGSKGTGEAFDFRSGGDGFVVGTTAGTVVTFDARGEMIETLDLEGGVAHALCCQPDGEGVAVALRGGGIEVRGAERTTWPQLNAQVTSLAWSPDCRSLIAGCRNGGVWVLDLEKPLPESLASPHNGPVEHVAWSRDGRLMASSSGADVCLWDGRQRLKLTEYSAYARTLTFSEDGLSLGPVTPDDDKTALSLLKVKRSEACFAVSGHPDEPQITGSTWLFNGALLATAAGDGLRFWNKEGFPLLHLPKIRVQPGGMIATGKARDEGGADVLFLAQEDAIYRLHLAIVGERLEILDHRIFSEVTGGAQLALSPDGKVMAVAHDHEVILIDQEGEQIGTPLDSMPNTTFVSISPDPDDMWLAAGTLGGDGVRLWKLEDLDDPGRPLPDPVDLEVDGSATVSFFPKRQLPPELGGQKVPPTLLTGDKVAYRLWRRDTSGTWSQTRQQDNQMDSPRGRVATTAFSPRGTVLVGSINMRYLLIMNPFTLAPLSKPDFEKQWPLAVDAEGRNMANEADGGRLFIWNLEEATEEMKDCGLKFEKFPEFGEKQPVLIKP